MPRKTTPSTPAADLAPAAPLTKGETTRAALLAAAHQLFLKQGFHGTSMRQIAEAAGLAVGGIYNHFATKEDIFAAVLDAYHPYHVILPALEHTEGETTEAFVRDAARRIRAGVEGSEEQLVPLIFMELIEFQGRHLSQLADVMLPKFFNFIQRFLTRPGRLRQQSLPILLRTLMSLLIGYLITGLLIKRSAFVQSFDLSPDAWFEGMVDIYLHGILAEPAVDAAPEA